MDDPSRTWGLMQVISLWFSFTGCLPVAFGLPVPPTVYVGVALWLVAFVAGTVAGYRKRT